MSIEKVDFEILTFRTAELVFKVLHELVGLGPDVAPKTGEVGQVK